MRSTRTKRPLSLLLACVLVFSLCGMTVFAAGDGTDSENAAGDTSGQTTDKLTAADGTDTMSADTGEDAAEKTTAGSKEGTSSDSAGGQTAGAADKAPSGSAEKTPADPSSASKTDEAQSWPVRYYIQNAALDGYAVALTGETADKSSLDEAAAEKAFRSAANAGFYHFSRLDAEGDCVKVYFDLNRYTFSFLPDSTVDLFLADLKVTGKLTGESSAEVWLGKTIDWPGCSPVSGTVNGMAADALLKHVSFTGWQKDGGNRCATGHYTVTANMIANGSSIPADGSAVAYTAQYSLTGITADVHYLLQELDGKTYTEDSARASTISISALSGLTGKTIPGFKYRTTETPGLFAFLKAVFLGENVSYTLKYDRADETLFYYDGAKKLRSETFKYGQTVTPAYTPAGSGTGTFAGWEDGNGETVTSFSMPAQDVYLYARWTGGSTPAAETFSVRWHNGGTLLKTDSVERGKTPVYTGSTPEKAADDRYIYAFSGWNTDTDAVAAMDALPAASADADYYAIFTKTAKDTPAQPSGGTGYTVTFKNWNGDTLKTEQVTSGGDATPPSVPARSGYTFSGWDRAYTNITADTTVTAQFAYNGGGGGGGGTIIVPPTATVKPSPSETTIPDSDAPKGDQPVPSASAEAGVTIPDEEVPKGDQPASAQPAAPSTAVKVPAADSAVTITDNETPKASTPSAKTGDDRAIGIFAVLAAASAAGLAATALCGRKKKRNGDR